MFFHQTVKPAQKETLYYFEGICDERAAAVGVLWLHRFLIEIQQRPLQEAATVTGNNPTHGATERSLWTGRLSTEVILN